MPGRAEHGLRPSSTLSSQSASRDSNFLHQVPSGLIVRNIIRIDYRSHAGTSRQAERQGRRGSRVPRVPRGTEGPWVDVTMTYVPKRVQLLMQDEPGGQDIGIR